MLFTQNIILDRDVRIILNNRQYGEIKLKLQSVVPRQYQLKQQK